MFAIAHCPVCGGRGGKGTCQNWLVIDGLSVWSPLGCERQQTTAEGALEPQGGYLALSFAGAEQADAGRQGGAGGQDAQPAHHPHVLQSTVLLQGPGHTA